MRYRTRIFRLFRTRPLSHGTMYSAATANESKNIFYIRVHSMCYVHFVLYHSYVSQQCIYSLYSQSVLESIHIFYPLDQCYQFPCIIWLPHDHNFISFASFFFLQDPSATSKSCPLEYPFETIIHVVHSGNSHNLSKGEFVLVLTKLLHLSTKNICSCLVAPNTQVDQCMMKYGSKNSQNISNLHGN